MRNISGIKTSRIGVEIDPNVSHSKSKGRCPRGRAASGEPPGYRTRRSNDFEARTCEGTDETVIAPLRRILQQAPHGFQARYQLAQVYRRLGRVDESKAEIRTMQESKKLRRQLTDLNEEAITNPRDAGVRDQLAEVCRKLGKERLAEMWARAADACREHETPLEDGS